jgi:Cdc6-like AAA superfamily ATPase
LEEEEMLSPLERARTQLHTAAPVPPGSELLCREEECREIRQFIQSCVKNGGTEGSQSKALYISGVPGTGKTACVQKVQLLGENKRKKTRKKRKKHVKLKNYFFWEGGV